MADGLRAGQYFLMSEFEKASDEPLTPAEMGAATWWAANVLDAVRGHYGVPVYVTSFVRAHSAPDFGDGPHGRRSAVPGNAVDFKVTGRGPEEVVRWIDANFPGTSIIWGKYVCAGNTCVHLTHQPHAGSLGGAGYEYAKPAGSGGSKYGIRQMPGGTALVAAPGSSSGGLAGGGGSGTGQLPGVSGGGTPAPSTKLGAGGAALAGGVLLLGLFVAHRAFRS